MTMLALGEHWGCTAPGPLPGTARRIPLAAILGAMPQYRQALRIAGGQA